MVNAKIGAEDVPERVIGSRSTLRHAIAPDKSLLWGLQRHIKIVSIPFLCDVDTEVDSGYDLPDKAIVLDAIVEVTVADVGETLDVGILSSESGGDADGLLVGIDVGTVGVKLPAVTIAGSTEDYMSACTWGALLCDFTAGADVTGDVGTFLRKQHYAGAITGKSVAYDGSAGSDTAAGFIHLLIMELP